MRIRNITWRGRRAWELDNGCLALTLLRGGGHIAGLELRSRPRTNPLWTPAWRTMEPWQYSQALAKRYGSRLLASICGHNLCLGWFGDPSAAEQAAGLGCHGEAPVRRWREAGKSVSSRELMLRVACDLPVAGMRVTRTLKTRAESHVVRVAERIENRTRCDRPFTVCQHVTFGPPFLERGVTVFDMPATQSRTFPGAFSDRQRLRSDTAFAWPNGPGAGGNAVDLRVLGGGAGSSSDFSAQLIDRKRREAWFSALHPQMRIVVAYVWRREDYPWVGNWEEDAARREPPWNGKSLARGMEFANTPFPMGLRAAVDRGVFQGERAYGWLPARGRVDCEYAIVMKESPKGVSRVLDIGRTERGFSLDMA